MRRRTATTVLSVGRASSTSLPPTLLERMDRGWSSFFDSIGIPHFGFIDGTCTWIVVGQAATGLDWSLVVMATGAVARCVSLPATLYSDRAAQRLALATAEVRCDVENMQKLYASRAPATEITRAAEILRANRNESFRKHRTSNKAVLTSLLGSPVFMLGLASISQFLSDPPSRFVAPTLLCGDLTAADPSGILPCAAILMTLVNFELSWRRKRAGSTSQNAVARLVPAVARVAALAAVPVTSSVPAALALYWCGASLVGLVQPLLMSSPAFRRWYDVPDLTNIGAASPATAAASGDTPRTE